MARKTRVEQADRERDGASSVPAAEIAATEPEITYGWAFHKWPFLMACLFTAVFYGLIVGVAHIPQDPIKISTAAPLIPPTFTPSAATPSPAETATPGPPEAAVAVPAAATP